MKNRFKKGASRIIGLLCAALLLVTALYVPVLVSAANPIRSLELKENEAYVFDFSNTMHVDKVNQETATGEEAIGYYGWGWTIKEYTDGENTNKVLRATKNAASQSWATSGGYRLHDLKADDTYGFAALEPSTQYVVSFKIRVLSSPVTISGSKEGATSYINLGYNCKYNPNASGSENNYINSMGTDIKVMDTIIDSNTFTLYDMNGKGTMYSCGEEWYTVTYILSTPESFYQDNALAFYTGNYHGVDTEIDDVSVTKIAGDSGIVLLYDEYSAVTELFIDKDGEKLSLDDKDISDRSKENGHVFEGWYADVERTQKISEVAFSKDSNVTVYSRWKAPVTITFKNTLDGSVTTITGSAGDTFEYPADPVDPEDKVWFMGWYKDDLCTIPHTLPKYGYSNETIYTYWKGEIPGLTQDFENYTYDSYTIATDANGQKYKSNRLNFAPTMTKQSEVTYNGSGNAVKYHWNPVQITDKNDHNYYDTSRVTSTDNFFNLGKGLEDKTIYNVTFKYLAEKADAPVDFSVISGTNGNAWANMAACGSIKNVTLEADGKWHEITIQGTTGYKNGANYMFLAIINTQNVETIVYFDDIVIEAFAQPYESVVTINTNVNDEILYIKGKRGDTIEFPTLTHPENAPFNGYYLDKGFEERYEGTTFERNPVTLYAQWLGYSGFTQDFENYTSDSWKESTTIKDNGTPNDTTDDYPVIYKSNYLSFYTTMSKQSEVVASGDNAIKFHWNTDPSTDKDVSKANGHNALNPESYEHKRYSAEDNLFYIGKGLEDNQYYTITFKYKVEKGDQDVKFEVITAASGNSWAGRKVHAAAENVKIQKTNGWEEYSFDFITTAQGTNNGVFLCVCLTENEDVIMYFDDVKIKSLANTAEVVMYLNTGSATDPTVHLGKKGEALKLPTPVHVDGAEFLGWYTDNTCNNPYTETNYPYTNTTLYAKWAPYAMTFREYAYAADSQKDPNINVVNKPGVGKGDDYAINFYVNRKADNTTGLGTTQAFRIADSIENGVVYRVKFDYKSNSNQSSDAKLYVLSSAAENLWWSNINNKYTYTAVELPAGGTGGWKSAEFVIRAVVNNPDWRITDDLYLQFSANIYKAGDKIDAYVDNVLVEKIETPYVFFDGQNGGTPIFVSGEVGDTIVAPKELPVRVGYTFDGWYLEPECLTKFTLETFEEDTKITVFAKWKESNTYVYSFENYTPVPDDGGWDFARAKISTSTAKTGKKSMHVDRTDVTDLTIFMLEDGGEYYKIESGSSYVLTLNYKVVKYTDTSLQIGFLASCYGNFFVGSNSGKTKLGPMIVIGKDEAKANQGKWVKKTFILDAMQLAPVSDTHICDQIYAYIRAGEGWDIYIDDVAVTKVPKGQVAIGFETEGATGCPSYLIGKQGQDYSSKIPETLTKEGMFFKGYYTMGDDGLYTEKIRSAMVFGDKAETIFGRFIHYEVNENFDTGYYDKAYGAGIGYTIHDFDYEVYDSEAEGNSKDNVTSGRYSLHRKGNSMYIENAVILTLGNQIAESERYTVTMKVKLGKHFHTDGAIKIVSSRDFEYAWTTTGDYYPVVPIAELADGQWHEVSYTFNSVEAFVSLQTPGYVELFIDDIKFVLADETVPLSQPKDYVEYVAAERNAEGNLVKIDRTKVDIDTIIDASIGIKPTYIDWDKIFLIGGISLGGIAVIVAALVVVLVLKKKKKAKANV